MVLDHKRIQKELDEDKSDINTVINKNKEIKEINKNKHLEVISKRKKLVNSKGREIPSFYGRKLKIDKHIHGKSYVARRGTLFEEIPVDFKFKFSFKESDFE